MREVRRGMMAARGNGVAWQACGDDKIIAAQWREQSSSGRLTASRKASIIIMRNETYIRADC